MIESAKRPVSTVSSSTQELFKEIVYSLEEKSFLNNFKRLTVLCCLAKTKKISVDTMVWQSLNS